MPSIDDSKQSKKPPPTKNRNITVHEKPFDFNKIKVIIKRKEDDKIIYLDKKWTLVNITHFKPLIDSVSEEEGIEITLTCNYEAFLYIIKYLQETNEDKQSDILGEITHQSILNILVTAEFLKLEFIYELAWREYFEPQFVAIINACKLDLSQMSIKVTHDIAKRISLKNLLELNDRFDKLISNVFRHRIDILLAES